MPKFFLLAAVLLSQADSDADNATPRARERMVLFMVMALYQGD
jgi:hypothetical protein